MRTTLTDEERERFNLSDWWGYVQSDTPDADLDTLLSNLERFACEEAERIIAARLAPVLALAEAWRYKGEFGWGAWQEGHGPDHEGYVLDQAAADLRAALGPAAKAQRVERHAEALAQAWDEGARWSWDRSDYSDQELRAHLDASNPYRQDGERCE